MNICGRGSARSSIGLSGLALKHSLGQLVGDRGVRGVAREVVVIYALTLKLSGMCSRRLKWTPSSGPAAWRRKLQPALLLRSSKNISESASSIGKASQSLTEA